jgi:hypothetical protein
LEIGERNEKVGFINHFLIWVLSSIGGILSGIGIVE